jgi:hypothetical protein
MDMFSSDQGFSFWQDVREHAKLQFNYTVDKDDLD